MDIKPSKPPKRTGHISSSRTNLREFLNSAEHRAKLSAAAKAQWARNKEK